MIASELGTSSAPNAPCSAARADQQLDRRRDRADERRAAEAGRADREDPPPAVEVAERAADEDQRCEHQQVGLDDPLLVGERGVEVVAQRRQRDVDDGLVDEHDRRAEDAGDERQPLRAGFVHRQRLGDGRRARTPSVTVSTVINWAAPKGDRHADFGRGDRLRSSAVSFPLLCEPSPCPGCHGTDSFQALTVYENERRSVTTWDLLALLGCKRCGLAFSHPLPTEAELTAFYSRPGGWESRTEGDPDADQAADLERKLASKHRSYARVRDLLAPHLPPAGGPLRALDFGCGLGTWLDVLQDDGWETVGIEPGPLQREHASRRHVMLDAPPTEPTFDLVIVNHVLEHLRDPLTTMRALSACTVEGGHIFISVPDLGRLPAHNRWRYVKNEHHICSYTVEALRSLLGLAGFRLAAHFDTPEWDALGMAEPWRLKVLGVQTGQVVEPTGEPLRLAIEALRGYEAEAARLREEARQANARKKAARQAKKEDRQARADRRTRKQEAAPAFGSVAAVTGRIGRALRERANR